MLKQLHPASEHNLNVFKEHGLIHYKHVFENC